MNIFLWGMAISLLYGSASSLFLYVYEGQHEYALFLEMYTASFGTLISLGLILGTSLIVFKTQKLIPSLIEKSFTKRQLAKTDYFAYKERYASQRRSITFSSQFVIIGFIIFSHCGFPLSDTANNLMIVAVCAEYALGVYTGRKIFYAGMMLHSLLKIKVTKNLFEKHELDEINTYVNIISALTIIFVYIHTSNYYDGPFLYNKTMEDGVKMFLLIPVIIATPVLLIFNLYLFTVLAPPDPLIHPQLRPLAANGYAAGIARRCTTLDSAFK